MTVPVPQAPDADVTVVRRFLDGVMGGGLDEAARCLHDEFVLQAPSELPYGGEYRGPGGFAAYLQGLLAVAVPERIGPPEVRDAGDCVLLRAESRFTSPTSGRSVDTVVAELYFVREGKIAALDIFYKDPGAIAALA
jgi:ketosteroid isomerase-like protein